MATKNIGLAVLCRFIAGASVGAPAVFAAFSRLADIAAESAIKGFFFSQIVAVFIDDDRFQICSRFKGMKYFIKTAGSDQL